MPGSIQTAQDSSESTSGVELPSCPVCDREDIPSPEIFETSIHSEGETVGLSRCPACRVYFTRPRLIRHNVSTRETHYDALHAKYIHEATSDTFHKNVNYRRYLTLARERIDPAGARVPTLLDIGCHCGFFLRYAQQSGWSVRGVEPSVPHHRFATEVNGITSVQNGFFDAEFDPSSEFDLVTMFDVLEHIPRPVELLREVHRRLRPGGVVMCKVPHVWFYLRFRPLIMGLSRLGLLPRYPTFLELPPSDAASSPVPPLFDLFEHVVHYDQTAAQAVFGAAGFSRVELLPAPPTNPLGDRLNIPRSAVFALARGAHALGLPPTALTHGLIMVGHK